MPVLHDYVSIVEAATVPGVHWETVKRLCREGRIPAQKVHNGWLIHIDEVQSFAKRYVGRRGRPSNRIIAEKAPSSG